MLLGPASCRRYIAKRKKANAEAMAPRKLLAKYHATRGILAVQVEAMLPKINPNQRHSVHDGLQKKNPRSAYRWQGSG